MSEHAQKSTLPSDSDWNKLARYAELVYLGGRIPDQLLPSEAERQANPDCMSKDTIVARIMLVLLKGHELNVSPMNSLSQITLSERGVPEIRVQLMMTLIYREAKFADIKMKQSEDICEVWAKRDRREAQTEYTYFSFSKDDAVKANLLTRNTYKQHLKDMLSWRALGKMARRIFPDIIQGTYIQGDSLSEEDNTILPFSEPSTPMFPDDVKKKPVAQNMNEIKGLEPSPLKEETSKSKPPAAQAIDINSFEDLMDEIDASIPETSPLKEKATKKTLPMIQSVNSDLSSLLDLVDEDPTPPPELEEKKEEVAEEPKKKAKKTTKSEALKVTKEKQILPIDLKVLKRQDYFASSTDLNEMVDDYAWASLKNIVAPLINTQSTDNFNKKIGRIFATIERKPETTNAEQLLKALDQYLKEIKDPVLNVGDIEEQFDQTMQSFLSSVYAILTEEKSDDKTVLIHSVATQMKLHENFKRWLGRFLTTRGWIVVLENNKVKIPIQTGEP